MRSDSEIWHKTPPSNKIASKNRNLGGWGGFLKGNPHISRLCLMSARFCFWKRSVKVFETPLKKTSKQPTNQKKETKHNQARNIRNLPTSLYTSKEFHQPFLHLRIKTDQPWCDRLFLDGKTSHQKKTRKKNIPGDSSRDLFGMVKTWPF